MNDSETPAAEGQSRPAVRRRAPTRRKSPARPKSRRPAAAARKSPSSSSARAGRRRSGELQRLLRSLARTATDARGRLKAASGDGARATRQAWQKASGASRKAIDKLAADWKQMDPARKAQLVAALLTALAAASAPIVRRGFKKR